MQETIHQPTICGGSRGPPTNQATVPHHVLRKLFQSASNNYLSLECEMIQGRVADGSFHQKLEMVTDKDKMLAPSGSATGNDRESIPECLFQNSQLLVHEIFNVDRNNNSSPL
jgi:hypothetical protein